MLFFGKGCDSVFFLGFRNLSDLLQIGRGYGQDLFPGSSPNENEPRRNRFRDASFLFSPICLMTYDPQKRILLIASKKVGRKISQYLLVSPSQRRDGNHFSSYQFIASSSANPEMKSNRPRGLSFRLKRLTGISPANVAMYNPTKINKSAGRIATISAEEAAEGDSGTVKNEAR